MQASPAHEFHHERHARRGETRAEETYHARVMNTAKNHHLAAKRARLFGGETRAAAVYHLHGDFLARARPRREIHRSGRALAQRALHHNLHVERFRGELAVLLV